MRSMSLLIRAYDPARDGAALRRCFVHLQDHEHGFDPSAFQGEEIVDVYVPYMLARASTPGSALFVAEHQDQVIGFASAIRVERPTPDDGDAFHYELGEISVLDEHRGLGAGSALVAAVEQHARSHGAPALRVLMGAENRGAQRLYARLGFSPCVIMYEKRLDEA